MRFERYLKNQIDWNNRLIAITGARGTGKTTMLLQHII
jgi:predicted AAA+ superfamily ATPase